MTILRRGKEFVDSVVREEGELATIFVTTKLTLVDAWMIEDVSLSSIPITTSSVLLLLGIVEDSFVSSSRRVS